LGFVPDKPMVLVTGGSLGARSINEAVQAALPQLLSSGVQVLWQCGSLYEENVKATVAVPANQCRIQAFVGDMAAAYAAADLVISRAGASTLSELAIAGKAAILIPSPNVAEDHQTKNARALEEKGAALLLPESRLQDELTAMITSVLQVEERNRLEQNITTLAKPMATEHIVDELLKLQAS